MATSILDVIKAERGEAELVMNDGVGIGHTGEEEAGASRKLTKAELVDLLAKREGQMRTGGSDENPTDQWLAKPINLMTGAFQSFLFGRQACLPGNQRSTSEP